MVMMATKLMTKCETGSPLTPPFERLLSCVGDCNVMEILMTMKVTLT